MKYCSFCGNALQDEMAFCPKCGKRSLLEAANKLAFEEHEGMRKCGSKKRKRATLVVAISVVAIITSILLITTQRGFSEKPTAIEKATESVVLITCYDRFGEVRSTGSGFILYDDSIIVTNHHVIDRALDIKVSTDSDHTFSVESILAFDVDKDIAILKTSEGTGLKCLSIGKSKDMKRGEGVVAIGSPLGNKNTVSTGVFSGCWYNRKSGLDEIQFSAPISSGSSGGALFNNRGQVVGITSASFIDGQNMNLAIPIEVVVDMFANKTSAITISELFLETYSSSANCYLSPNNTFVEFSDIVANPQNYLGKVVTTIAYITNDGGWTHSAFISSEDVHVFSKQDEVSYYIYQEASMAKKIEDDYVGYIKICGTVDGYLGEYVVVYEGKNGNIVKAPHIKIKNEYFELLG